MCGIAGIIDIHPRRDIDRDLLERMNKSQLHRGPDQGGVHVEPGVGLAHRRLSIIDLSNGKQPLYNEDESVVVVYNGEIYNFQGLAEELKQHGHTFRTHCDTEVIVHAWEQWGEQCVRRFRGMFAFAIWDRNKKTFFAARDRLGIKPLYYALLPDGRLTFASELKALLVDSSLPRKLEASAVEEYFAFGYVPEPKTILEGVYKLHPGHTLTLSHEKSKPIIKKYWDVSFRSNGLDNVQDIEHELIERLREAVKIRLVAEVPLGAFLSGGVDSSSIVAMMAGLSSDPVKTCSIAFDNPDYNESDFASQVATQYRTDHFVERVKSDDFDLIDILAGLYDEPYADSSAIPTYRVCELARKKVIVALSGDGGDENFAGYRRYRWHMHEEKIRSLLPQLVRRPLFGMLGKLYPKADWAPRIFRAKSTFQALARNSAEAYLHSVSFVYDDLRSKLFSDEFKRKLNGYHAMEVFQKYIDKAPTDDALSLVQYLDMKTYLPGDILTKVDRASMAHSLEVRVPILDHEFVEWVSGLPSSIKLSGGEGKHIFKSSLKPYLSNDILYRKKMGFAVPLSAWFRGPLRDRVRQSILGGSLIDSDIFNHRSLHKIVDENESGVRDHSTAIWTLLMFEASYRNVLDVS
ncbi:MAG: amidotransferase 1, exosortase A system-associated [Gammaproteobacteria bacterium]|nr:amidotransferase 1, exosortase A system-associated [Gammaproteobacteria bacterium]